MNTWITEDEMDVVRDERLDKDDYVVFTAVHDLLAKPDRFPRCLAGMSLNQIQWSLGLLLRFRYIDDVPALLRVH